MLKVCGILFAWLVLTSLYVVYSIGNVSFWSIVVCLFVGFTIYVCILEWRNWAISSRKYHIRKDLKHPTQDLYRIQALRDFGDVKRGDIGGWVKSAKTYRKMGYVGSMMMQWLKSPRELLKEA